MPLEVAILCSLTWVKVPASTVRFTSEQICTHLCYKNLALCMHSDFSTCRGSRLKHPTTPNTKIHIYQDGHLNAFIMKKHQNYIAQCDQTALFPSLSGQKIDEKNCIPSICTTRSAESNSIISFHYIWYHQWLNTVDTWYIPDLTASVQTPFSHMLPYMDLFHGKDPLSGGFLHFIFYYYYFL